MNITQFIRRRLPVLLTLATCLLLAASVMTPGARAGKGSAPSGGESSRTSVSSSASSSLFEQTVQLIKKFEGLSGPSHWPYVGYGHRVQSGDGIKRGQKLSESQADALLRKDLLKLCALYRSYGSDSLLLGALAYNTGPGTVSKSSVLTHLKSGNRQAAKTAYLAHSKYRGKTLAGLKRRRQAELDLLFNDHNTAENRINTHNSATRAQ